MTRYALAVAATALGLCMAQGASAQTVGTTGIDGIVTGRCGFTPADVTLNIGEMSHTTGTPSLIATLDPTTLTSRTVTLNGTCNGASATMTVQAFPLLNTSFTGTAPTGFETRVDYTATATEGPANASASSLAPNSVSAPSSADTFTSGIIVSFTNAVTPGGGKLVAGSYTGSVEVVLTPAS